MPFRPGDTLGPYEITDPLGAGGMGEVWKARDTRVLARSFASSATSGVEEMYVVMNWPTLVK